MSEHSNVRLSICIATLNRGDVIGMTLESMISQATPDLEIVILDGGSSDNTSEVVRQYQQQFARLHYLRAPTNGGVDRDFDRAIEAASGEYCWLMSDDDPLLPGAIAAVFAAIDRDFSLIVVNAEVRTRDMSQVIESRRLVFDQDREYGPDQMDSLFTDAIGYMSFIGCVVIRRSIWLSRDRQSYFGSLFIHAGVIFQAPLPGNTLIIARPLISIRYGNALWKRSEFEIWMFKWPRLLWSFDSITTAVRATVCKAEPWRKLRTLLFYRGKGTYSAAEYRRLLRPHLSSVRERIGARAISMIPGFIANVIGLLYSLLPNRSARMIRVDLMNSRYYIGNWFHGRPRP